MSGGVGGGKGDTACGCVWRREVGRRGGSAGVGAAQGVTRWSCR